MKVSNELSGCEALNKLRLFLKFRKGKQITEKTLSDFENLTHKLFFKNFKDYDEISVSKNRYKQLEASCYAIKFIKSGFMKWELKSGFCKISDISEFGEYTDNTYKAKVNGELRDISLRDYYILRYIFFGEL